MIPGTCILVGYDHNVTDLRHVSAAFGMPLSSGCKTLLPVWHIFVIPVVHAIAAFRHSGPIKTPFYENSAPLVALSTAEIPVIFSPVSVACICIKAIQIPGICILLLVAQL